MKGITEGSSARTRVRSTLLREGKMIQQTSVDEERILVTGGTGHLGRDIVSQLLDRGKRARVLARLPGTDPSVEWARGDLSTGAGLREALAGVTTVIHAATFSPIAQRGGIRPVDFFTTPSAVDVDGTRRLLAACRRARVRHFLHVSIVGLDGAASLPYSKVKLQGEALVRQSDLPWSVVRAGPFYYLLARLFGGMRWMPWWILPTAVMDAVDTADVASYLIECVDDGRLGLREEIGGPAALPLPALAREYLQARGLNRRVIGINVAPRTAARLGFAEARGRKGVTTWREWLAANADEPKGRVRHRPLPATAFTPNQRGAD
ncbi:Cholesterol dehydrogenase [Variovorax sp. SRS16]|uniref:SDR family oxidoreductase n=1 Tax=Variovorax sp. SRS16 TaxID=282217 RepID=UPI0013176C8A|nr:NAD(P)H-binding protein [Variovorax sp. SRS16]VTU13453.1 Cholesterol dehydrogenase [Variovorax sp. SRS16]